MRRVIASLLLAVTVPIAAKTLGAQVPRATPEGTVPPSSLRSAVETADSLYQAMDAVGAMGALRARLEVEPDDFEATWRGAAVALTLGVLNEDRAAKLGWLRAAVEYGDRLLALRPADGLSLTWAAAAKGRLAIEERNPVATARLGKDVWALTDALLASDPGNPMGNAVRGKLVQEVRRLSWAERMLARMLLGSDVVGSAKWSDSERYLERAVAGDPDMVLYRLDLGDTYRLQGKTVQALEVYRRGLALPDRLPVDPYFKRRIMDGVRTLSPERPGEP